MKNVKIGVLGGLNLVGCKQDILYIHVTFFLLENKKKTKFQTFNLPLAYQNK
jgi:hypothetical protein